MTSGSKPKQIPGCCSLLPDACALDKWKRPAAVLTMGSAPVSRVITMQIQVPAKTWHACHSRLDAENISLVKVCQHRLCCLMHMLEYISNLELVPLPSVRLCRHASADSEVVYLETISQFLMKCMVFAAPSLSAMKRRAVRPVLEWLCMIRSCGASRWSSTLRECIQAFLASQLQLLLAYDQCA